MKYIEIIVSFIIGLLVSNILIVFIKRKLSKVDKKEFENKLRATLIKKIKKICLKKGIEIPNELESRSLRNLKDIEEDLKNR